MPKPRTKFAKKKTLQKMIKNTVNRMTETKYRDFDVTTPVTIDDSGYTQAISLVPDGTTAIERIGQSIRVYRVEIKGYAFSQDAVNNPFAQRIRLLIVRDNQEGAQTPQLFPDVIETGFVPTNQQFNWDTVPARFEILREKYIVTDAGQGPRIVSFNMTIKKTMLMKWNGAGATASGKGRIYLMACSDNTSATAPSINYTVRLYFKDN